MKSYLTGWSGLVFGAAVALAGSLATAEAQTLRDALAAAYTNNPELLSQREQLRVTIEQVPQALSNWRPRVELGADYGLQRSHLNTRSPRRQERDPRSLGISVTQPLFRGFRTEAAVDQAEVEVLQGQAVLAATEQDILLSAVTAFMNVVRDQAVLDLNVNNEQVLQRQLEATVDRFNVGEITRTDVSQAEARLAGARAIRIAAQGNLQNSRATYFNIIGEVPGELSAPQAPSDLPPSLDATIGAARSNHPSVIAASYEEQSAAEGIRLVKGELLPTVDLVGSVNRLWESTGADTQQTSSAITLDLSVPLYQRGAVYSRLRAAKITAGRSRLDLEAVRRDRIEAANFAWETLETARASIESFNAQIEAAQIALEGVQREAAVGSRTVLDVLDAEQELLNARVNFVTSRRDEIVAAYQLKAAVGEFTAKQLELPVSYYDPADYYNRVRNKLFGGDVPGSDGPGGQ